MNGWLTPLLEKKARTAFKKGRSEVELSGRVFTLTRQSRNVRHLMGDKYVTFKESWLLVRPADGGHIPMATLELGENLRSVK